MEAVTDLYICFHIHETSLVAQMVKNLPVMGRPWLQIFPGEGNGYPPQYSCLDKPMDRGVWRATVHGVTKSWR